MDQRWHHHHLILNQEEINKMSNTEHEHDPALPYDHIVELVEERGFAVLHFDVNKIVEMLKALSHSDDEIQDWFRQYMDDRLEEEIAAAIQRVEFENVVPLSK
jgi:hypothetical protein